jgi:hypothetical protein
VLANRIVHVTREWCFYADLQVTIIRNQNHVLYIIKKVSENSVKPELEIIGNEIDLRSGGSGDGLDVSLVESYGISGIAPPDPYKSLLA